METDPHPGFKLFDNARAYSKAATLMNAKAAAKCNAVFTHVSQSSAIYAALAIDYYLKTLYYLQHKKEYRDYGKTPHDFSSIYNELKHKTKKDLENRFAARIAMQGRETAPLPQDLKTTLKHWTDAFARLRVQPGRFNGNSLYFFQEMEEVFKTQILNEHPEWGYRSGKG